MKQTMMEGFGVPDWAVLCEETSATTDENALVGSLFLSRTGFMRNALADLAAGSGSGSGSNSNPNAVLNVGVLSNLFHLPRALDSFRSGLANMGLGQGRAVLVPVFAEDYCVLSSSREHDWAKEMQEYYRVPRGGVQWDAAKIGEIMRARRGGSLNVSVGSLAGF